MLRLRVAASEDRILATRLRRAISLPAGALLRSIAQSANLKLTVAMVAQIAEGVPIGS